MSWLPSDIKKTVVMIGDIKEEGVALPAGSGVLVNYQGKHYAISAGHVIRGLDDPVVIFNDKTGAPTGRMTSELSRRFGVNWEYHPDDRVDLTAIPFGINTETDDLRVLPEDMFQDYAGINDGEDVFFMGFPLSLSRRDTIVPVIRQGCIDGMLGFSFLSKV